MERKLQKFNYKMTHHQYNQLHDYRWRLPLFHTNIQRRQLSVMNY